MLASSLYAHRARIISKKGGLWKARHASLKRLQSASEGILSCRRTPPAAERWLEYHRRGAATVRGA